MASINDLAIPSGLEELYYAIFALNQIGDVQSVYTKPGRQAHQRAKRTINRSLFRIFQSLYDSFDSTRRTSWNVYWATLPFGDHSGGGGWPGSGYSAFVYVNAPRYRAGQDLLLDPPVLNLIFNGDFAAGFDNWNVFDWYLDSGVARCDVGVDGQYFFTDTDHHFDLTLGTLYHMSLVAEGAGAELDFQVFSYGIMDFVHTFAMTTVSGLQSDSFTAADDYTDCIVQVYANPGWSGTVDDLMLYA